MEVFKPECECRCGWAGMFDNADKEESYEPYGEAFGSAAYRVEVVYLCPCCGKELEEVF